MKINNKQYRIALKRAEDDLKELMKDWIECINNGDGTITVDSDIQRVRKFQLENVIEHCQKQLSLNKN